jgi:nitronate monooxygenase
VPVFSIGLGNPGSDLITACHHRGMKVIAMVTTVEDARAMEVTGADSMVLQGSDTGGHRSRFEKPVAAEGERSGPWRWCQRSWMPCASQ